LESGSTTFNWYWRNIPSPTPPPLEKEEMNNAFQFVLDQVNWWCRDVFLYYLHFDSIYYNFI